MKTDKIYLGIDTSNYTTSAALCVDGVITCNFKMPLPVSAGERGLRQSDAVFAHVKNLPSIMDLIAKEIKSGALAAVGYSRSPRDAGDSYMPCFLCGAAAAHSAAAAANAVTYGFSHQAGHVTAALYSSEQIELLNKKEPFACVRRDDGYITYNSGGWR